MWLAEDVSPPRSHLLPGIAQGPAGNRMFYFPPSASVRHYRLGCLSLAQGMSYGLVLGLVGCLVRQGAFCKCELI